QIDVTGTGNALDGEIVTNAGVIDVRAGGALTVDPTTINNANGTIVVDASGKLTLNAATIDGGTVTNNGEIDLAGGGVLENGLLGSSAKILVSGAGNALHSENVTANNALELQTGADLAIDEGTIFANGGGTITIDTGATLSANDAAITGGTITNKSGGIIKLTGGSTTICPPLPANTPPISVTRTS